MTNQYKITLENIIQLATILLQAIGLFVLKPDIFNFRGTNELFAGGNIYNFILIFISIIFIFLGYTYQQKTFAIKWFIVFIISGLFFIASFFYYDKIIENKTVVFISEGISPIRIAKGNRFVASMQDCAKAIQQKNPDITDLEIIKNCNDVTDISQLLKVWPEKEVKQNMFIINIWYCILISLATITLISGLQALKCKRIQT